MKKTSAILLVILAGILWGTSGIFVHYLAPLGFSSAQMTAIRSGTAALAVLIYAIARDREAFRVRKIDLCIFMLTAIGLFCTGTCYFISMRASSISTAVVLMYTAPIYVMLFSIFFFGEKINVPKLCAIAMMLVGCALVSGVIGGMKFSLTGILTGVISGISYAVYNILTKLSMKRGVRPMSAYVYVFSFTFLIALFFTYPSDMLSNTAKNTPVAAVLCIGMGILTFILPYVLYTLAMRRLDATTTSSLGIAEPASAALFGILLFDERIDIYIGAGMLLILAAILLTCKNEKITEYEG